MKIGLNCSLCELHKNNPENTLKFYGGGAAPLFSTCLDGYILTSVFCRVILYLFKKLMAVAFLLN